MITHPAARLYEEIIDLKGEPLHTVMDKITDCIAHAKTDRARMILSTLLDDFCCYVHDVWAPPGAPL